MDRRCDDKRKIKAEEPAVAVGSGEDFAGGEPAANGVDDGDKVNRHRKGENHRGAALRDIENGIHRRRLHACFAVARFRPAIDNVGDNAFGQNSVQLIWLWQEWQPASPDTAPSRSCCPRSRTSLTNVQARLSAAGPR